LLLLLLARLVTLLLLLLLLLVRLVTLLLLLLLLLVRLVTLLLLLLLLLVRHVTLLLRLLLVGHGESQVAFWHSNCRILQAAAPSDTAVLLTQHS
jgi:hypothetical protein